MKDYLMIVCFLFLIMAIYCRLKRAAGRPAIETPAPRTDLYMDYSEPRIAEQFERPEILIMKKSEYVPAYSLKILTARKYWRLIEKLDDLDATNRGLCNRLAVSSGSQYTQDAKDIVRKYHTVCMQRDEAIALNYGLERKVQYLESITEQYKKLLHLEYATAPGITTTQPRNSKGQYIDRQAAADLERIHNAAIVKTGTVAEAQAILQAEENEARDDEPQDDEIIDIVADADDMTDEPQESENWLETIGLYTNKYVRAYFMKNAGASNAAIGAALGIKAQSVRGYVSQGKNILAEKQILVYYTAADGRELTEWVKATEINDRGEWIENTAWTCYRGNRELLPA